MDDIVRQRLVDFVRALDSASHRTHEAQAACHHSAVEVNDWKAIRQAMEAAAQSEEVADEASETIDNAQTSAAANSAT